MRLGIDASNIRTGGGLTHLAELLGAAQPHEHGITRIVIWAGQRTLEQLPVRTWLEPKYEPLLDQPLPLRLYWQKVKLPRLAEQSCDCLFVPGGSYSGSFRPVVTMSRNLLPYDPAERRRFGVSWMRAKLCLLRVSQTKSLRDADGVIFLSEYASWAVRQAANIGGWHPIIPHGVNKQFYLAPRFQRSIDEYSSDNPFKLLYVSKVEPYKHQWNVVEAVALLRRAGVPVSLELIGGQESPAAWRRLVQVIGRVDPRSEFIHYLGHVPYHDLAAFYHQADGFVFASSCENLPNILLEAMAAGLPIACSNFGPMPEVLGDAGIYFNPERPEEIARMLQTLIEAPDLRRYYGQSGHERAQLYSWERCAGETLSYIVEIARKANVSLRIYRQICRKDAMSAR